MLVIKGIIIGIGKIIPGVSGSMLAISMGIYQKMIDSINHFFSNVHKNFIFLFKIGIGVLVSIVFFSNIILFCLKKYYLITIFFFIGLIIGSFKDITSNTSKKYNYISFIIFLLTLIFGLINVENEVIISNSLLNTIFFFFVGLIDAITMVIPGISGTATLMMIGAYNTLIKTYSNIFDFDLLIYNIKILIPFGIGLIIGLIITAKIVDYLFKYHKNKTYSAILGFSLSTIVLMAIKCLNANYCLLELIISFMMLFIGILITKKINHKLMID